MKQILTIFICSLIFQSCTSLEDAGKVLRNEKTQTTDEFLVKKRKPLVLPPDYNKLPVPGSIEENRANDGDKLKQILKSPTKATSNTNNRSSVEESIIDKIRK